MHSYMRLLARREFRLLWIGSTISVFGDSLTFVALVWLVYEMTASPGGVGSLIVFYTAPVAVGGLVAGIGLDRFDRRAVLVADNALRGVCMAAIPVLFLVGALQLWHLYVVAAAFGLLKMFSLAGVPAMIPSIVPAEALNTANAMETIAYGVSGMLGPAVAGVLIAWIGAPNVLAVDAFSYFVFVACLLALRPHPVPSVPRRSQSLWPAIRFIWTAPAILTITVMFMCFNVGEGILAVLLPVYAREILRVGAAGYGLLLGAAGIGGLVGALVVGSIAWPWSLGRSIAGAQLATAIGAMGLLLAPPLLPSLVLLASVGVLQSPLTIWAQTMRMRLIPSELRGRVISLLRTAMQSAPPLGGAFAGVLLSAGDVRLAIIAIAAAIGIPGLLGLRLSALDQRHIVSVEASFPQPAAGNDDQ